MDHKEMFEKAKEAKSVEELMSLAKENGMELSKESATAYFEEMHKSGELSDEELDNVAGGGCHSKDGRLIVSEFYSCENGVFSKVFDCSCVSCKYSSYEKGLRLCNHPANTK